MTYRSGVSSIIGRQRKPSPLRLAEPPPPPPPDLIDAIGGTITTPGDGWTYHTFTEDGTFEILSGDGLVEYLVVGPGGGGGRGAGNGGGGGGSAGDFVPGSDMLGPGTYPVTIATGGSGSTAAADKGGDGSGDSSFNGTTAAPGVGGGSETNRVGKDGPSGSGGGAQRDGSTGALGGTATGINGHDGGQAGQNGLFQGGAAGGGGGAGSAGGDASSHVLGGPGGNGRAWDDGSAYAAGGGGGAQNGGAPGDGGSDIGGDGAVDGNAPGDGAPNTGSGGGGGGNANGGSGSDGVVVIRHGGEPALSDPPFVRSVNTDWHSLPMIGDIPVFAPRPAGIETGDLLLLFVVSRNNGGGLTLTDPTGGVWTLEETMVDSSGFREARLWSRVVTDALSEPTGYVVIADAAGAPGFSIEATIVTVAGANAEDPLVTASTVNTGAAPSVTSDDDHSLLVNFFGPTRADSDYSIRYTGYDNGVTEHWQYVHAVTSKELISPNPSGMVTPTGEAPVYAASVVVPQGDVPSFTPPDEQDHVLIVFDGQSLNTAPYGPSSMPSQAMLGQPPHVTYQVPAIGGSSWTELAVNAEDRLHRLTPYYDKSVLFLSGGFSDIWSGAEGDTAAQALAEQEAYADAARAAGYDYIIAATMPDVNLTGADEQKRIDFNDGMRVSDRWDVICDFDDVPEFQDSTDSTYYQDDNLHWNATGAAIAGEVVEPLVTTAVAIVTA